MPAQTQNRHALQRAPRRLEEAFTNGVEDGDLSLDKVFSELSTDVGALRQLETRMNGTIPTNLMLFNANHTYINTDQRSRIVKRSARNQSRIPKAKASRKSILHKILEKRTNTAIVSET